MTGNQSTRILILGGGFGGTSVALELARLTCLGTCAAGDSFGELALAKNSPRTATVRCLTPVNVLVFKRADFQALVGSFQFFRAHILERVAHLASKDAGMKQ